MKYDRKANLSTKSCSDFSVKIDGKLEIVQNAKSCSKSGVIIGDGDRKRAPFQVLGGTAEKPLIG